jgi:hypothetical protein
MIRSRSVESEMAPPPLPPDSIRDRHHVDSIRQRPAKSYSYGMDLWWASHQALVDLAAGLHRGHTPFRLRFLSQVMAAPDRPDRPRLRLT